MILVRKIVIQIQAYTLSMKQMLPEQYEKSA